MLEALVAIGLAGNIVQFVQSASTLISQTRQIYRTGAPSSMNELKKLVLQLTEQTTMIREQLERCSAQQSLLQEDQVSTKPDL